MERTVVGVLGLSTVDLGDSRSGPKKDKTLCSHLLKILVHTSVDRPLPPNFKFHTFSHAFLGS